MNFPQHLFPKADLFKGLLPRSCLASRQSSLACPFHFYHKSLQGLLYLQQDQGRRLDLGDQMDQEDPGHKQRKVLLLHPGKSTLVFLSDGLKGKNTN